MAGQPPDPDDWRAILDFERRASPGSVPRDQAVRERFGLSPARYHQLLDRVIERDEALEYDPMLVRRLRRLRDARRGKRLARRLGDPSGRFREEAGGDVWPASMSRPTGGASTSP
jgi:hypothetical protein